MIKIWEFIWHGCWHKWEEIAHGPYQIRRDAVVRAEGHFILTKCNKCQTHKRQVII